MESFQFDGSGDGVDQPISELGLETHLCFYHGLVLWGGCAIEVHYDRYPSVLIQVLVMIILSCDPDSVVYSITV